MAIRIGENSISNVRFRNRNLKDKIEITPSIKDQTYAPPGDYEGFKHIVAKGVTAAVDRNIHENNILEGVEILGVKGKLHLGSYDIYQVPNGPSTCRLEIVSIEGGTDSRITERNIEFYKTLDLQDRLANGGEMPTDEEYLEAEEELQELYKKIMGSEDYDDPFYQAESENGVLTLDGSYTQSPQGSDLIVG